MGETSLALVHICIDDTAEKWAVQPSAGLEGVLVVGITAAQETDPTSAAVTNRVCLRFRIEDNPNEFCRDITFNQ